MSSDSQDRPPHLPVTDDIIKQLQTMFAPPPGIRGAHAKGLVLTGTFHPTREAEELSCAPIFSHKHKYHNMTIRLSSPGGNINLVDYVPSPPRGMALRFHYDNDKTTDMLLQSSPHFPVKLDGQEFLEFLIASMTPETLLAYASTRPYAMEFLKELQLQLVPSSFARQHYWSVIAYEFTNAQGESHFVRYRLVPDEGDEFLTPEQLKEKADAGAVNFLYDEMKKRLHERRHTSFRLEAQVANPGDVTDDTSVIWPEDRRVVILGKVQFETVFPDDEQAKLSQEIIYEPMPDIFGIKGIKSSADPLLPVRGDLYWTEGLLRRAAQGVAGKSAVGCPVMAAAGLPLPAH
jgi:catalase